MTMKMAATQGPLFLSAQQLQPQLLQPPPHISLQWVDQLVTLQMNQTLKTIQTNLIQVLELHLLF